MWGAVAVLGLLGVVLPGDAAMFAESTAAQLGQKIYETNCAVCHGARGDGAGEAAHLFETKPQDFTKGKYKLRSTPSGSPPTDADLIRTITGGIPGTAMVPQDHLSDAEILLLVQYLKGLSERFARATPPKPIVIPPPPPPTPARIARGLEVYQKAECFQCHGHEGKGDGPSAPDLSVKPADLTKRPLKSGQTPQDLFRTILTGFDGTPMPAYQFILEDEELWDLIYHLESLARPAEVTEDERKGWEVERKHQNRSRGVR